MVKENQIWKVVLGKHEFTVCVLRILPGLDLAEPNLLKFCECLCLDNPFSSHTVGTIEHFYIGHIKDILIA